MTQPLAEFAAGQLRAEMARRQLSPRAVAERIGHEESWVRKRMRGRYAITLSDLEEIALALDVPPTFFIEREVVAA